MAEESLWGAASCSWLWLGNDDGAEAPVAEEGDVRLRLEEDALEPGWDHESRRFPREEGILTSGLVCIGIESLLLDHEECLTWL